MRRGWWLISVALLAPGVVFLVGGILDPGKRTDDGMSYRAFGAVWMGMMLILHAGLLGYLQLRNRRAEWLARHGLPATATILAAEFTGTEVNSMPEIELVLEIALPGEAPYRRGPDRERSAPASQRTRLRRSARPSGDLTRGPR